MHIKHIYVHRGIYNFIFQKFAAAFNRSTAPAFAARFLVWGRGAGGSLACARVGVLARAHAPGPCG